MSTFAANNVTTWFGGYDMTADLNQTSMPIEWEALDATTYSPTRAGRSRAAGLEDVSSQMVGLWQAGTDTIDPTAFDALRGAVQVMTHSWDGAEGSVAYCYQAREFSYQLFGDVGQLVPFTLNAQGTRGNGGRAVGAVRGPIVKAKGDVSATGATGTAAELGDVGADEFLYAGLHVFGAGTTITAVLESAADNTFAGATTRITFGPITAKGSTWGTRVAGAITDTWYRLRVTAVTGTFSIACVAGIK